MISKTLRTLDPETIIVRVYNNHTDAQMEVGHAAFWDYHFTGTNGVAGVYGNGYAVRYPYHITTAANSECQFNPALLAGAVAGRPIGSQAWGSVQCYGQHDRLVVGGTANLTVFVLNGVLRTFNAAASWNNGHLSTAILVPVNLWGNALGAAANQGHWGFAAATDFPTNPFFPPTKFAVPLDGARNTTGTYANYSGATGFVKGFLRCM